MAELARRAEAEKARRASETASAQPAHVSEEGLAVMSKNTATTRPYHWVMTLQAGDGRRVTTSGLFEVPAWMGRNEAYERLCEQEKSCYGLEDATVLFFSLEPNLLGGGR